MNFIKSKPMIKATFWYSGAYICPRKQGYDVLLSSERWVHRNTERQAKWAATAYKTLNGKTFKDSYAATTQNS
jgi:hypothetical protein